MSEDEKGTLWIEPRCRPLPITDYGDTDFPEQMVLLGDDRLLQVNGQRLSHQRRRRDHLVGTGAHDRRF